MTKTATASSIPTAAGSILLLATVLSFGCALPSTAAATTTSSSAVAALTFPNFPSLSTSTGGTGRGGGGSVETTPVIICPGFGNDKIDYVTPLDQPREVGLTSALERRGFSPDLIRVLPVNRADWLRVAGGLFDPRFYTNTALPTGNGYGWYVKRLQDEIDRVHVESGGERVLLLGHSAGGWLARAAMGDGTWRSDDGGNGGVRTSDRVRCLTTIGAIHRPPAVGAAAGCVTRGALAHVDSAYPGAYLSSEGVGYVSVGGDAIVGDNTKTTNGVGEGTDADRAYAARGEGSSSRVAFASYEAVCGEGDGVRGDGVVPLEWSHLDGARQVTLDGVLHSINEAGTTMPTDRWYGSEGVIDRWLPAALEEAGIRGGYTGGNNNAVGFGGGLEGLRRWAREGAAVAQRALPQLPR